LEAMREVTPGFGVTPGQEGATINLEE
jgi:hypothetical protein